MNKPGGFLRTLDLRHLWVPVYIMVGISILSDSAGVEVGSWSFAGLDKIAHFFIFGLLGVAWVRCFPAEALSGRRRFILAVALTALFGLGDEMHQAYNPLRMFEWADAIADVSGALVFVSAYLRLNFFRRLLEMTLSEGVCLISLNKRANSP